MRGERTITIVVEEQSPLNALATVAREIVQLFTGTATNLVEPDKSTQLAVDAATPEALVAGMVDDLCEIAAQFDAIPVSISVDGFRRLPDGYRVWGVVGLSYTASEPSVMPSRLTSPIITHGAGLWGITIVISII